MVPESSSVSSYRPSAKPVDLVTAETYTPDCDYDMKAHEFKLLGVDDQIHTLESCQIALVSIA